jgi:RHS repeat-associated protein
MYDTSNGGLNEYEHADYLGSLRLATTPARGYVSSLAYAPFGEQYSAVDQGGAEGFAGGGVGFAFDDYGFPFRDYSAKGRWTSPDPAGLVAVDPTNPQSLNRYAYVLNNPLANTDPTGLEGGCDLDEFADSFCQDFPWQCSPPPGSGGGGGQWLPLPPRQFQSHP